MKKVNSNSFIECNFNNFFFLFYIISVYIIFIPKIFKYINNSFYTDVTYDRFNVPMYIGRVWTCKEKATGNWARVLVSFDDKIIKIPDDNVCEKIESPGYNDQTDVRLFAEVK